MEFKERSENIQGFPRSLHHVIFVLLELNVVLIDFLQYTTPYPAQHLSRQ